MADLVVDGFQRYIGGHHAGNVVLEHCAKDAAKPTKNKQPHQHTRERAAKVKSAMKKNDRQTECAKPEMAAHPGLSASQPPYRHTLSRAKQRGKKHERKTEDAKGEPGRAPASGALNGIVCVDNVGDQRGGKNYCGSDGPSALGAVNTHRSSTPS